MSPVDLGPLLQAQRPEKVVVYVTPEELSTMGSHSLIGKVMRSLWEAPPVGGIHLPIPPLCEVRVHITEAASPQSLLTRPYTFACLMADVVFLIKAGVVFSYD